LNSTFCKKAKKSAKKSIIFKFQMMCASLNQTYQDNLLLTDIRAPNEFRVNTLLANYPQFATTFKCPAGANMNPATKCTVW
jgi:predicted metalloendopeptidase